MSRYFVVTSWGRTANFWLAKVFNAHPDVFCAYGPDLAPDKLSGDATSEELNYRHHRDGDKVTAMPVDDYFDILQQNGEFKVYGSIHGLTPEQAISPARREISVVNLVRHPVDRVASLVKWWAWEMSVNDLARLSYQARFLSNEELGRHLEARFGVDFGHEPNWLFVNAVSSLGWDRRDFDLGFTQVPMERLTTDETYFRRVAAALTGGEIDLGPMVSAGDFGRALNKSGRGDRPAEGVYAGWEDWQRFLFGAVVEEFELAAGYQELGYELP